MRAYLRMLKSEPGFSALVTLIFFLGVVLRCYIPFVDGAPFVHDGGLHLVLAQELVANNFVPPHFTSYNFLNIPYVYPPLSTYLTAGLHVIFDIPIEAILRYVPALISCLVLWASFRFLGVLNLSRLEYSVAILTAATLPYTFFQLIKGGGISRGLGALFAFLAMREICLLLDKAKQSRHRIRNPELLPLGVTFGLTCLSHPEWALAVLLFMLSAVLVARNRQLIFHFLASSAVAVVVSLPWAVIVLSRHGLDPILNAAFGSGESLGFASLISLRLFPGVYHPLLVSLAYLGFAAAMFKRRYLFPLVFIIGAVFQTRGHNYTSALPLAVLIAYGFSFLIGAAQGALAKDDGGDDRTQIDRVVRIAFALLSALSIADSSHVFAPTTAMRLRPAELQAFEWIRENTPASARFVILHGSPWWLDYLNEVFPAFAKRQSLTTCQGTEWLPDEAFSKCKALLDGLSSFHQGEGAEVLRSTLENVSPDYILVVKTQVNPKLLASIISGMIEFVFENEGIVIGRFADGRLVD